MRWHRLLCVALLIGIGPGLSGCRTAPTASEGRCADLSPPAQPVGTAPLAPSAAPASSPNRTNLPSNGFVSEVRPAQYTAPRREPTVADQVPSQRIPAPGELVEAPRPNPAPTDCGHDLNFSAALSLASRQNPRIAFAQERVNASFARFEGAKVLWLPSIQAGVSYNKTEGPMQDTGGLVHDVTRGALNTGLGVGAVGAGTPRAPGLFANFHAADAIFQPRIAGDLNAAGQAAFNATLNDTLLDASLAYLALLKAMQQQTIALETLRNAQQLADLTKEFARVGQGAQADADRAATELVVRQNTVLRVMEDVRVASARLAELLNLDPAIQLHPQEPTIVPIELTSPGTPARELVAIALSTRPELSESRALVSAAVATLRREEFAPLVPSILLGISEGGFGGGRGAQIDNFHDRFDVDAIAVWQIRNLGFGERTARDEASARLRQARSRDVEVMNRVAREVVEAHAQVQSRQGQIATAEAGIKSATDSYRRNLQRIREGQGLPIEVLQSLQALDQARQEYLRSVTDYDEAQFRLYRAQGWPISDGG